VGNRVLPVIDRFATFLSDKIPKAIDAFKAGFEDPDGTVNATGWQGSLQRFAQNVRTTFDDIKEDVGNFVAGFTGKPIKDEDDPFFQIGQTARQLVEFVRGTLIPAIQQFAKIVAEDVIPPLATLATWILTNKDLMLALVAAFATFKTVLFVTTFLQSVGVMLGIIGTAAPVAAGGLSAVGAGGIAAGGGLAIAAAAGVGLGILLNRLIEKHFPDINRVLEQVGAKMVDVGFGVADLGKKFSARLGEAGGAITDFGLAAKSGFDKAREAVGNLIGRVGNLISKLKDVVLPPDLRPGSPTPFELGLRGIIDAMGDLSRASVRLRFPTPVPVAAGGAAFAASGAGRSVAQTINVYEVAQNPQATAEAVASRLVAIR